MSTAWGHADTQVELRLEHKAGGVLRQCAQVQRCRFAPIILCFVCLVQIEFCTVCVGLCTFLARALEKRLATDLAALEVEVRGYSCRNK